MSHLRVASALRYWCRPSNAGSRPPLVIWAVLELDRYELLGLPSRSWPSTALSRHCNSLGCHLAQTHRYLCSRLRLRCLALQQLWPSQHFFFWHASCTNQQSRVMVCHLTLQQHWLEHAAPLLQAWQLQAGHQPVQQGACRCPGLTHCLQAAEEHHLGLTWLWARPCCPGELSVCVRSSCE